MLKIGITTPDDANKVLGRNYRLSASNRFYDHELTADERQRLTGFYMFADPEGLVLDFNFNQKLVRINKTSVLKRLPWRKWIHYPPPQIPSEKGSKGHNHTICC